MKYITIFKNLIKIIHYYSLAFSYYVFHLLYFKEEVLNFNNLNDIFWKSFLYSIVPIVPIVVMILKSIKEIKNMKSKNID